MDKRFLDTAPASGSDEVAIGVEDIAIHLEQQIQSFSDVTFGGFAKICGDGMRLLGGQRAELELRADFKEVVGTLP